MVRANEELKNVAREQKLQTTEVLKQLDTERKRALEAINENKGMKTLLGAKVRYDLRCFNYPILLTNCKDEKLKDVEEQGSILHRHLDEKAQQIQMLEMELQSANAKLEDQTSRNAELRADFEARDNLARNLKKELAEYQQRLKGLQEELLDMRLECSSVEALKKDVQQENEHLEKQISEQEGKINFLELEVKKVTAELENSRKPDEILLASGAKGKTSGNTKTRFSTRKTKLPNPAEPAGLPESEHSQDSSTNARDTKDGSQDDSTTSQIMGKENPELLSPNTPSLRTRTGPENSQQMKSTVNVASTPEAITKKLPKQNLRLQQFLGSQNMAFVPATQQDGSLSQASDFVPMTQEHNTRQRVRRTASAQASQEMVESVPLTKSVHFADPVVSLSFKSNSEVCWD